MKRSVKKLVVCGIVALMVCALCSLVAFAASDKPEPAPTDGTSVSEEPRLTMPLIPPAARQSQQVSA